MGKSHLLIANETINTGLQVGFLGHLYLVPAEATAMLKIRTCGVTWEAPRSGGENLQQASAYRYANEVEYIINTSMAD